MEAMIASLPTTPLHRWIQQFHCRHGKHKTVTINNPLGYGNHPHCVCECERCGIVQQWAGAWDSVVCIGEWKDYDAFLAAHDRIPCELQHEYLRDCNYCPDCGKMVRPNKTQAKP